VHSEFRDGNVPAGYEQLRVLEEAARLLPAGVTKLYLRSDTAGYQHDLLKYCAEGLLGHLCDAYRCADRSAERSHSRLFPQRQLAQGMSAAFSHAR